MDAVQLRSLHRQMVLRFEIRILIGIIRTGFVLFVNKVIDVDPETGLRYYIDPISMIIANMKNLVIQLSSHFTIRSIIRSFQRYTISVVVLDSTLRRSCLCSNNSGGNDISLRWHWTSYLLSV
jgi:hypothetical protein